MASARAKEILVKKNKAIKLCFRKVMKLSYLAVQFFEKYYKNSKKKKENVVCLQIRKKQLNLQFKLVVSSSYLVYVR